MASGPLWGGGGLRCGRSPAGRRRQAGILCDPADAAAVGVGGAAADHQGGHRCADIVPVQPFGWGKPGRRDDARLRGCALAEDDARARTGLERLELENPDLFRHNEVIRGPFGTPEEPVQVESAFESRIVGCTGHAVPDDHELMWILVKKGEQCRCPLCDQVFVLRPAE
eukprot:ctg_364.g226